MIRRIGKLAFWSAMGCGLVLVAGFQVAESPVETPAVGPPTDTVSAPAGTSVRMLTEDAMQTMEWLRLQHQLGPLNTFPSAGRIDLRIPSVRPEGDGTGVDRTIRVESSPVVNSSPRFQFSDATDRSAQPVLPSQQIPMKQRVATAEAYRQSLAKDK